MLSFGFTLAEVLVILRPKRFAEARASALAVKPSTGVIAREAEFLGGHVGSASVSARLKGTSESLADGLGMVA